MPVKIINLPAATEVKNSDLLPASQEYPNVDRDTYKISVQQLKNFINSDISQNIQNIINQSSSTISNFALNADTRYVNVSGDTMTGSLDLSGNMLKRFKPNIIVVTTNTILTNDLHNGAIILGNKARTNIDDRLELQINPNSVSEGFNALLIQIGDCQLKVTNPQGGITIANPDDALSTRTKYSQINLCLIQPTLAWVTGDMV